MATDTPPVQSVTEFLKQVEPAARDSTHGSFTLFRGQGDASWQLLPGIARPPFKTTDICSDPDDQRDRSKERRLLIVFRDHAPPLLPQWTWAGTEAHVRWKQIVVAQHSRLPTRLLDWTSNPLVALFFATEKPAVPCNHQACAYRDENGFHHSSVSYFKEMETTSVESLARRNKRPPVYDGKKDQQGELSFVRPPDIDHRVTAQSSFFSVSASPGTPLTPEGVILVSASAREEIRKQLNVMGINRKTLFPGLEGLVDHLRWDHLGWQ